MRFRKEFIRFRMTSLLFLHRLHDLIFSFCNDIYLLSSCELLFLLYIFYAVSFLIFSIILHMVSTPYSYFHMFVVREFSFE